MLDQNDVAIHMRKWANDLTQQRALMAAIGITLAVLVDQQRHYRSRASTKENALGV